MSQTGALTDPDLDLDHASGLTRNDGAPGGGVGKLPATARLMPAANITIFRVADMGTALAIDDARRDPNGVAGGAQTAVERATSSSSGTALPDDLRLKFESCLDTDLSGVRVHTGEESAEAARSVGARAYATGQDIHFAPGQYDPRSTAGEHLLAHEVAHTVQQSGAVPAAPQFKLEVSTPGDAHEVEADRAADAMVSGLPAEVSGGAGVQRKIARDVDKDMQDAAAAGGDYGANDGKVRVIMGHTTTGDENEAKAILTRINAAETAVSRHPDAVVKASDHLGPIKAILTENVDARFVLEQYLATVSESGNFQSEFAASYMSTKKDYGEFSMMYQTFEAAGGSLKAEGQANKMASLSKDPEFLRAREKFDGVRTELKTDATNISKGQIATEGAKESLMSAIYAARKEAAAAKASSKKAQLATVMASINDVVSTIMTVGQIAAAATTGILAMGSGGFDMSKLVESGPEIEPGNAAPGGTPSLAPPDVKHFTVPGTDLNPHGIAAPEDGLGKAGDTRSYQMPSQTVQTAKELGGKAVGLLGGPKEMLAKAITMLEQANIDRIQSQIEAAQEEGNLNQAAAAAADMKSKRLAYQEKITTLADNVGNLMNHKSQMDTAVKHMVAAAKKQGAGKDLTGAIRLVGSGDKFLSQIGLTISLGEKQQQRGKEATLQRYNVNAGPFSTGTAQGPGQLHNRTVEPDKNIKDFVAIKNQVQLKSSGNDSLQSGSGRNSTQFDVGQCLDELREWQVEVQTKRNAAERALDIGVTAGRSG